MTASASATVAVSLTLLALPLFGCAARPIDAGAPRVVERLVIAPYAMQEECADLAVGDRLDYRYESSAPVDFSLHYIDARARLAPIVREQSTADSGVFEARLAQRYCASWEAGPPGAIVSYRLALRRAAP